jgi:hypothetical protein
MKCQHCGSELTNKRAKNCSTCAALLTDANKRGTYGFVIEAIAQAKRDGLTGEAMRAAMSSAARLGQAKRAEWSAEYRAQQKAQAQAESKRIAEYVYDPTARDDEDARTDIESGRNFVPASTVEDSEKTTF